jgi:hypothetical protein
VRAPPYYVRGTTDRPFLAQLIVHLAPSSADREGALANPPLTVEHWVDVSARAVCECECECMLSSRTIDRSGGVPAPGRG